MYNLFVYYIFFFKKYNLNFKKDILDLVVFFFFCIIITSSLREILILNDFKKADLIVKIFNKISVIRFFFIYWLTKNILQYNLVKIENFFKISLYCVIFVSINILLMHLIGNDIFGNREFANRFSTIFGERAVAGTYLLNFFFFGLIYFYHLNKKNSLIIFFFTLLISLGILLTLDRMPIFLFLLFFFFICLLNIKKDYRLLIILLIILPILFFLVLKYEKLSNRYSLFLFGLEIQKLSFDKTKKENINYYSYVSIYKDSINTFFFEKSIIGSGNSSFYSRCKNYRMQTDFKSIVHKYAFACPKHTHHLYLEVLIASGALGFIVFVITIILKFFLLKKNLLNQISSHYTINSILLITLILEIFPFRTYGDVFNSYNGFFFFLK